MAEVKITIQMTDEEYEAYKKFASGDYIKNMTIYEFVRLKGIVYDTKYGKNPQSNKDECTIEFKEKGIYCYMVIGDK